VRRRLGVRDSTRRGGSAVVEVPQPNSHLGYDMPPRAELRAVADRHVAAHGFPPFGPEVDESYYERFWYPPGGVEGAGQSWEVDWAPYGGYTRSGPDPRIRLSTDSDAVRYRKMIDAAKGAGLDGVHCDLLSNSTSSNDLWERSLAWQAACHAHGDFDFIPMVDATASFTRAGSTAVADHLNTMMSRTSAAAIKRIGGRLGYSVFSPESAADGAAAERAFWDAVHNRLLSVHGKDTYQINCHVGSSGLTSASGAPNYRSAAYVVWNGRWGVANPVEATARASEPADFQAEFGRPWMHYARISDQRYTRTTGLKYEESDHTACLRATMRVAIEGGAQALQVCTFDDYRETSAVAPSLEAGYAWLDLLGYYISWYKLKARRPVWRDTSYLSWRPHRFDKVSGFTSPDFDPANIMPRVGSTPGVATVENLAMMTAPGEVHVEVAGVLTTTSVTQATIDASWDGLVSVKAPHPVGANGGLKTWITRNGQEVPDTRIEVSAADGVTSTPVVQDLLYRLRTSREHLRPPIT